MLRAAVFRHFVFDFLLHGFKRSELLIIEALDDVPAKCSLKRLREITIACETECCVFKLQHHLTRAEPRQFATLFGRGRIVAVFTCQFFKGRLTREQLLIDLLDFSLRICFAVFFRLWFHNDVCHVHFATRRALVVNVNEVVTVARADGH